jgi:Holliday junction DNA helicase RuvA
MIAFLKGLVSAKLDGACLVDVNGVGYEVNMPGSDLAQLPRVGEAVTLYTWYHGREDGVSLFGFMTPERRALFKLLLGVAGVGPKLALAVLSGFAPAELASAVSNQDIGALTHVPGIGRKTAERLLLELKDKLPAVAVGRNQLPAREREDFAEALEALLALGYSSAQARTALQKVADEMTSSTGNARVVEWVRRALQRI